MKIHTLVLWTKHPKSLLTNPLFQYLVELKSEGIQLHIQLTITGLDKITAGKKSNGNPLLLEPYAPHYSDSLSTLPEIIKLVEKPERIRLRIDPIVRIQDFMGRFLQILVTCHELLKKPVTLGLKHSVLAFLRKTRTKKLTDN